MENNERKNISQYRLIKNGIDNKKLDNLKKNKNVTLLIIERLSTIMDCQPNDIVELIKEQD